MGLNRHLEKQLIKFREMVGLSAREPVSIKSLLFKLEILTIFKPLSDDFSGMALKISDKKFILVNSNHNIGRQNFTIGHELYHLFIQEDFKPHKCKTNSFDSTDKEEQKANKFSANLLMPEDGLLERIPEPELGKNKIKIGTVLKLEQIFGVSHSALLYRLKTLGYIDIDYISKYNSNVVELAIKYGFPTNLYKPANKNLILGDYGTRVQELFDAEKISEGHYHELKELLNNGE